jgi:hypothetical protein
VSGINRFRAYVLARHTSRMVLFRQIERAASAETDPLALLRLAEAPAWIVEPGQPHGPAPVAASSRDSDGDGDGDGGDGD